MPELSGVSAVRRFGWLAALLVGFPLAAAADLVTFEFGGEITEILGGLDAEYAVGDGFSVRVTYDTDTPAGRSYPCCGSEIYRGAASDLTFSIGQYVATAPVGSAEVSEKGQFFQEDGYSRVTNFGDQLMLRSSASSTIFAFGTDATLDARGRKVSSVEMWLRDTSGTAIDGVMLPSRLDLADFDFTYVYIQTASDDFFDGPRRVTLDVSHMAGQITSIRQVPEPTGWLLAALAALSLARVRRS